MYAHISENELFPTMEILQKQHVDTVQCHTFLSMLISMIIFDILQICSGCKTLHFISTPPHPAPLGSWISTLETTLLMSVHVYKHAYACADDISMYIRPSHAVVYICSKLWRNSWIVLGF